MKQLEDHLLGEIGRLLNNHTTFLGPLKNDLSDVGFLLTINQDDVRVLLDVDDIHLTTTYQDYLVVHRNAVTK